MKSLFLMQVKLLASMRKSISFKDECPDYDCECPEMISLQLGANFTKMMQFFSRQKNAGTIHCVGAINGNPPAEPLACSPAHFQVMKIREPESGRLS